MIQDLSYPCHDPTADSVNAGINSSDFPTMWGSFESTAELILSLPNGCVAATFDISAAYWITLIRPSQQNVLCVFWEELVWVDQMIMFSMSSSAGVFGSVTNMLVTIYEAAGFGPIRKWVDNFLAIQLPHLTWTEEEFIALTADIGVPWSLEKLWHFVMIQCYIGFDWDLSTKSVSIPQEKLDHVVALLKTWVTSSSHFTAKEAASLHGKLVHLSCIFPLICPFL